MQLIPIQCQSCGAQLNIDTEDEQVQCPFCGTSYVVKVSGGTIALRRATESLERIDRSTREVARELKIARLKEERRELEVRLEENQQLFQEWCKNQTDRLYSARSSRSRWGFFFMGLSVVVSALIGLLSLMGLVVVITDPDLDRAVSICPAAWVFFCGLWFFMCVSAYRRRHRRLKDLEAEMAETKREMERRIAELEEGIATRTETIAQLLQNNE